MEGLLIAFHRGWTKRGLVFHTAVTLEDAGYDVRFQSRNKKKFIMSASRAEVTVKLFQDYLHVATFLVTNKQCWVFTEVVWTAPSSSLWTWGICKATPCSWARVRSDMRHQWKAGHNWRWLPWPVEWISPFVLEKKNLCSLTQVWTWRHFFGKL